MSVLTFASYGTGYGALLEGEGESLIDAVDRDTVLQQLADSGYILFRGFEVDIDHFSAFVRALSTRVSLDPARSFGGSGGVAQKVDAGVDAVGLHCENGNSPFLPDLCWFYCERAAVEGSQTTVCDGYRAWDALSEATRRRFLDKKIVYSRRVEEDKWKRFAFHMLEGRKPIDQIVLDDILAPVRGNANVRITGNDDGSIHYAFEVAAARQPQFGGERIAFANSILGPSYNYETPKITFADGEEFPEPLLAEIRDATESVTENIDWQDGDVLLIDNTRAMHGRRAIRDANRVIYNALSDIR